MKSIIAKLGIAFVGVLLILTFFSNTIYSLNVPGVVVALPERGMTTSAFHSQGIVEFSETTAFFTQNRGNITVYVREGYWANESRALFSVETETGIVTTYAAQASIVREISAGLESGMMVDYNRLVMRLGTYNQRYTIAATFPEHMGLLPNNTAVLINIPILGEIGLQGTIRRMTTTGGRLQAEISFTTETRIHGGERAEITIEQFSEIHANTIPNAAIHRDALGYFLLYITRERNAMFGRGYYTRQERISIIERGDHVTAFSTFGGGSVNGPIIIASDRPVEIDSRVRVVADQ